jgi:hypothetical protein
MLYVDENYRIEKYQKWVFKLLSCFCIFLFFSSNTYSQSTFNYSYTDPCTGSNKTIQVPSNGITVTYYGQIHTFQPSDFYDNTFTNWSQSVYQSYGNNNPCASVIGLPTAISITQQTTINLINIFNSLSTLQDLSEISSGLGGSVDGVGNVASSLSNSSQEEKKENKKSVSTLSIDNSTSSNNNLNTSLNKSEGSNSSNNIPTNSLSNLNTGSLTISSDGPVSINSTSLIFNNNNNSNNNTSDDKSTINSNIDVNNNPNSSNNFGNTSSSNFNITSSINSPNSSSNTNLSNNSTSATSTTNSTPSGSSSSSSSNSNSNNVNSNTTNTSSNQSSNGGSGKVNVVGNSINSIQSVGSSSSKNGNRPNILASSDFVGFNFKNSDVNYGGKISGGYTSMRWDGLRSSGLLIDYTSAIKGPNISGFYAFIHKRRIDVISTSLTMGFDTKTSIYGTLALGQMWKFKKPKDLKFVYMVTSSLGSVYQKQFFGTAFIAGGMYDWKLNKRFDVKLMGLYVYAPYVKYYNDILLKSPHVILPIVGTNIAITKRFKFNINIGGAYAIKENVLNYTVMCGTRLLL